MSERELTDDEVRNICMSYRHGYGLMDRRDAALLEFQCREWHRAIQKHAPQPQADKPVAEVDSRVIGCIKWTTHGTLQHLSNGTPLYTRPTGLCERTLEAVAKVCRGIATSYRLMPSPTAQNMALGAEECETAIRALRNKADGKEGE